MTRFEGRTVLVTGGSSGIGQAIAVRFGEDGANVAINYRKDQSSAEETAGRIAAAFDECRQALRAANARTHIVQADVASADDVTSMVADTISELGGLDILINNAGIQVDAASHEMSIEDFDRVIATNLRGAFLCARAVIGHWLGARRPGIIINVSSVHEVIPKPRFAGYSASKGGLGNLTRTLALEYAGRGIRVNGVGPGATITPINQGWADDLEKRAEVERHIPMGRAGSAEEMAAVTAFLCSDEAAYVTGQTLYVDGGPTLYPDFRSTWSSD